MIDGEHKTFLLTLLCCVVRHWCVLWWRCRWIWW